MSLATDGVVFSSAALVPEEWRELAAVGPVRAFNPALLADGNGWIFAYRMVAADGRRRIALCRLDASLQVVAGSPSPLSDYFQFDQRVDYPEVVRHWFADPRLYRFRGRVFIYWNSGWHEPQNEQFLHELEPVSLRPIGRARPFRLAHGSRQTLEKNWTLFATDEGQLCAIYSVTPHRVLRFTLEDGKEVVFDEVDTTEWSLAGYPRSYGGLRGGTPPVRYGGGYVSIGHSVHDGAAGYRYVAAAYRFSPEQPFRPTHRPAAPLPLYNPYGAERVYPSLNPAVGEVVYPCGAVVDGERCLVSHGINDEHCAVSILPVGALGNFVTPIEPAP